MATQDFGPFVNGRLAATISGTDLLPNIQASVTKKSTVSSLDTYLSQTTNTLTNKTISGSANTITNISLTGGVTGVLPVANGGTNASSASITAFNNITGYTASGATGTTSTNLVFSTSPSLTTPLLGTPTSGTLTNCTGLPISTGVSGLGTGVATFLATPSSANLATAVTDETGSGALVFANTPTLVTPAIGAATGTSLTTTGTIYAYSATAIPAGGTAGSGIKVSSTSNFGMFFGSGAPTLTAAQGSVYLRSDGTSSTGLYTNTDGATTWAAVGGGGGTPGGSTTQVQYNNSGSFAGSAGFVYDGTSTITLGVAGTSVGGVAFNNATSGSITLQPVTGALGTVTLSMPATTTTLAGLAIAQTFTRGQTITQGTANEAILTSTGYSLTGANAQSLIDLAGTWNTSGTPTAIKLNVTDTASNAVSLLIDLKVGGTTQFSVRKDGTLTCNGITSPNGLGVGGITVNNNNTIQWGNGTYFFGNGTTGSVTGAFRLVGSGSTTTLNLGGDTSSHPALKKSSAALHVRLADDSAYAALSAELVTVAAGTATPAAGSTAARLLFGTTAGFGIYYGSGAPTVSAAQGSIYLRSDGSGVADRLYVNTTGSTTWTNFVSAA